MHSSWPCTWTPTSQAPAGLAVLRARHAASGCSLRRGPDEPVHAHSQVLYSYLGSDIFWPWIKIEGDA